MSDVRQVRELLRAAHTALAAAEILAAEVRVQEALPREAQSPWTHPAGSTPACVRHEERWNLAFSGSYKIEAARKAVRSADRFLSRLDNALPVLPAMKVERRRRR